MKATANILAIGLVAGLGLPLAGNAQTSHPSPAAAPVLTPVDVTPAPRSTGAAPATRLGVYANRPPISRPRPDTRSTDPALVTAPFFQIEGSIVGPDGVRRGFGSQAWSSLTRPMPFALGDDGAIEFDAWRSGEGLTVLITLVDPQVEMALPQIEMTSGETLRRTLPGDRVLTLTAVVRNPTPEEAAASAAFLQASRAYDRQTQERMQQAAPASRAAPLTQPPPLVALLLVPRVPDYPAPPPIASFIGKAPPPLAATPGRGTLAGPSTPLAAIRTQDVDVSQEHTETQAQSVLLTATRSVADFRRMVQPPSPDDAAFQIQGSLISPGGEVLAIRNHAWSGDATLFSIGPPSSGQGMAIDGMVGDDGQIVLRLGLVLGAKAYAFEPIVMPSGSTSVRTLPGGETLILTAITRAETEDEKAISRAIAAWRVQMDQARAAGTPQPRLPFIGQPPPPPIENYLAAGPQ